ncbi:MAG: M4 family metallopeptidase [candidate division Zixibacteria bacterium]|nr:M4 family metallopeptidase [candidate division Zixibacteria bacterium]
MNLISFRNLSPAGEKSCRRKLSLSRIFVALIVLISAAGSRAQSPGNANSFLYIDCGVDSFVPPGPGTVCFDIRYHIEGTGLNRIAGLVIPLAIFGSNNCIAGIDTTVANSFPPASAVSGFTFKIISHEDTPGDTFRIAYSAINFSEGITGDSLYARICLQVNDTGYILIDTTTVQSNLKYSLTEQQALDFTPGWGGIESAGYPPGGTTCEIATCHKNSAAGSGLGVSENLQDHIDTWYNCDNYLLRDLSRQSASNPHGHNGGMRYTSYISTGKFGVGELTDTDNVWDDTSQFSAVDAHVYAGLTYDYLFHNLSRNGIGDSGRTMLSLVDNPFFIDSAVFDPSSDQVIYSVPGPGRRSLAGSLDLVARLWGFGITKYTSSLKGSREAGAMRQSFSDMLGVAVEWENGNQNWTMGESSFTGPPSFLRDLSDPTLTGQADTRGEGFWKNPRPVGADSCLTPDDSNDSCWVGTNMGIPNKVFYLLAYGGTHNGVTVAGVGVNNAMKIMYRANQQYWNSNDSFTFLDAAIGSINAAFDLDSLNRYLPVETSKAWYAVNVCNSDLEQGDLNNSGDITITDVIYLANYTFSKDEDFCAPDCWPIVPKCRGDLNGDGKPNIVDIIWLVNLVFDKDKSNCPGSDSLNCWLPRPSGECCGIISF